MITREQKAFLADYIARSAPQPRSGFDSAVWAATYAAAWHHEYLRRLETSDAADKHRDALDHGRERECIEIADRAVSDLRRADAMAAEQAIPR